MFSLWLFAFCILLCHVSQFKSLQFLLQFSVKKESNFPQLNFFSSLPGGSRHNAKYYDERVLFFLRHFSNWSSLYRNALTVRVLIHFCYLPNKHITLFQHYNNVVDVQITLLQRQNDVVCLLGSRLFHSPYNNYKP